MLLAASSGAAQSSTAHPPHSELKLATWNLEWFTLPETFRALRPTCAPRDAPRRTHGRFIPCDVANQRGRSAEDIRALARYARELDADVIALQEVDGVRAARQLFPRHSFCFSKRSAVQNLGFAVRSGIPHACGADLTSLSLGDTVRRGVELRLFPGSAREMRLLSVHLKSGCSRDPLDSSRESCGQLARQVPELKRWMDMQSAAGLPFAVLGDFNRDLLRSGGGLWPEAGLVNTAEGQSFQNCMPSQTFSGYIDYILLSRDAARGLVAHSFGRNLYRPADAARRKLSDHCPLFIRLRLLDSRPSPT